ncbi:MAG: YihY family inner membrane protein [Rhodospirillales bacterium]|nr:YihY family inner membrane protein [Rhodospirillales bacterium]
MIVSVDRDRLKNRLGRLSEFCRYVWSRFHSERCLRMAASLSYTSLLAIVPLTAIAFAMLAAFPVFDGVREEFQTVLFANLLPDSAEAMRDYFDQFVRNTARLTAVGIVGLALTAVLLLGTIESSLNAIFRVARPRALVPRLLAFWALITLGPLLLGASFSLSTFFFAATEWLALDILTGPVGRLAKFMPTVIIIVLLVFFYAVIPNRPVRLGAAAIGGILAGLLFAALRGVFGYYVASFPTYQTIYGAVSVVPIFLVWMYLSWTVVLLGAVLTAAAGEWRLAGGCPTGDALPPGERLRAAVAVLAELGVAARKGGTASRSRLLRRTHVGDAALDRLLQELRQSAFVEHAASGGWLLARDLRRATLLDLMDALTLGIGEGLARGADSATRLGVALADARGRSQQALALPLSDFFDDDVATPAEGKGKAGLRPVS